MGKILKILLVATAIAGLLWVRSLFQGWLLPDGQWLEALAQQVRDGGEAVAQAVLGGVWEWLDE